tara:strand:+ start:1585 stop:1788 length:204 start_codon:yes stop_codon:yes gene_type:complete
MGVPAQIGGMLIVAIGPIVNLFPALFILLPVHPLEDGKLLHLVLIRFLPGAMATRVSGGIGLVLAVL